MTRNPRRLARVVGAGALLVALAIANAAGYRFGVSDQAFYIPSILRAADSSLYPRDAALLDAQGRLMVSDELTAWVWTHVGIPLEPLMLAGHVLALSLLFGAAWRLADRLGAGAWTGAACCLAITLRHRITETGANTFEGYFHPRGLAFAAGAWGAVYMADGRWGRAWALAAIATVLHPTTGLWWLLWMAGAACVLLYRRRVWLVALAGTGLALTGLALAASPLLAGRLRVMDEAWTRPFASKDYVFPTAWQPEAWLANLVLPLVVGGVWLWRRRTGVARGWEAGLVAGVVTITGVFLASLPFIAARVALAVQLQTSRVFWLTDLFAVIYATWTLAEGGARVSKAAGVGQAGSTGDRRWRPVVVAGVLLAASLARGLYVTRVEHPERAFVQAGLEDSDWVRVGRWLAARTPKDTHVLADPDHDWKYGHSVRVTARRDVLVEGVKDAAVSLYDRDVARRVQTRLEAIGDFASLDATRATSLARRFDLDVLVADRDFPLPELHREGRFRIYGLPQGGRP